MAPYALGLEVYGPFTINKIGFIYTFKLIHRSGSVSRLDFQPFCAPAFLRAHHGWITGLPYCILDQSETCLHESCRQVSDWSIQSCQQQRWRLSLRKHFFLLLMKTVSELFKIGKFGKYIKKH